ncbi:hypothetical protein RchiOBHm_Chr3g0475811 [Rosa chinensis]|uniref:Uncharacterized protein n=1 Tax=Rosa chinensis TaxID=74649 RepID=A0A2P6RCG4_ROSCH|nr:hypothetical protein RchiOBHm_Chr3g0475811 [Rosa chinensis]
MWSSVRGFSWKALRMECCRTPVLCELFFFVLLSLVCFRAAGFCFLMLQSFHFFFFVMFSSLFLLLFSLMW